MLWLAVQKKIQCGVDGGQQLDTEAVLFQEVAEPKSGGFVGQAHPARVHPRKFAVQRDIMQGFLHRRVRQSKPLLQEVDAQHGLNGKRRASAFGRCATGCKRLNQANQFGPRHHQVHLVHKHSFARPFGDQFKSGGGKADLFHKRRVSQSAFCALGFADNP